MVRDRHVSLNAKPLSKKHVKISQKPSISSLQSLVWVGSPVAPLNPRFDNGFAGFRGSSKDRGSS